MTIADLDIPRDPLQGIRARLSASPENAGGAWVVWIEDWTRPRESVLKPLTLPATLGDVVPEVSREFVSVALNSVAQAEPDWEAPLAPGDILIVVRVPGGPVVLFIAALLPYIVVSMVISGVISNLLPDPPEARIPQDDSSSVYGWGGIRTNYQPKGQPYPNIYGEHAFGGAVARVWVDARVSGQEKLFLLLVMSKGPIHSIGGIENDADALEGDLLPTGLTINGNKASELEGVKVWLRMGTYGQEVIEPFADITTLYTIDLPLPNTTGSPATDWDESVEFDLPATAEKSLVGVQFPRGLYQIDGNGNVVALAINVNIRYREIDGVGTPLTDWQDAYDQGVGVDFTITEAIRSSFVRDLEVPFWDPPTFIPPGSAVGLKLNDTVQGHYARIDLTPGQGMIGDWQPGGLFSNFSILTRVRSRTDAQPHGVLFCYADQITHDAQEAVTAIRGIMVDLISIDAGAPVLALYVGDGSSFEILQSSVRVSKDTWYQLVITYERGTGPGGSNLVRLWRGNTPTVLETAIDPLVPDADPLLGTINSALIDDEDFVADVNFGDFAIFRRKLDQGDVAYYHNTGSWFELAIPPEDVAKDLVGYWKLAPVVGIESLNSIEDANHFEWFGPSGVPPQIGVPEITTRASGRARETSWRVQVRRKSPEDGNNAKKVRDIRLARIQGITLDEVAHTGLALLGMEIEATEQLNSSQVEILVPVKGRSDLPVWDGVSVERPTFRREWSSNPYAILAHIVTDKEDGGGEYHTDLDVDWPALSEWGAFCDGEVYDQRGKHSIRHADVLPPDAAGPDGYAQVVFEDTDGWGHHWVAGESLKLVDIDTGTLTDWGPLEGVPMVISQVYSQPSPAGRVVEMIVPAGITITASASGAAVLATGFGVEPRLKCDLVLSDPALGFWDAVNLITSTGRASPVRIGDKLSVVWQRPRQPTVAFNAANIIAGSFSLRTRRRTEDFNVVDAEIQNELLDWERDVIERQSDRLQNSEDGVSTETRRPRTINMIGVTRESQAKREMDFRLKVAELSDLIVSFNTLLDAYFLTQGVVAVVSFPLPDWSFGGQAEADSADSSEVVIDVPIVLEAAVTYYAAIRSADTDEVAFAQVSTVAGTYPAGTTIELASALPFIPEEADLWAIGPVENYASKTFQVTSVGLTQGMRARVSGALYLDELFPDEDAIDEVVEDADYGGPDGRGIPTPKRPPFTPGGDADHDAVGLMAAAWTDPGLLPEVENEEVGAIEEAYRDFATGGLETGIRVDWLPDSRSAHRLWRTRVFARNLSSGEALLATEVGTSVFGCRVPGRILEAGETYEIIVQHETRSGVRRGLARCARSQPITLRGYFPPPAHPSSAVFSMVGDDGILEVELADNPAGTVLEFTHGGAVLGLQVDRIAFGMDTLRTPAWGVLPKPIPYYLRAVLPDGTRSADALLVPAPTVPPPGYELELASESYEDGPWDTAPAGSIHAAILTRLQIHADGYLHWTAALDLDASWTSWETDLGACCRVHVAFGVDAIQIQPEIVDAATMILSPNGIELASWTGQGPTNPRDPLFGECQIFLEWSVSVDSGDPGSNWQPFRSGVTTLRSCRFRIRVERPSSDYDVRISLAGLSIRNVPMSKPTDYGVEVALGKIPGVVGLNKFGRNTDIDSSSREDIWDGGGIHRGILASAESHNIASTSANDAAAGTGARTMLIEGVDDNFDLASETVTLDGLSDVATVNSYRFIHRMMVKTAGVLDMNAGDITATPASGGAAMAAIVLDNGRTQMALFVVPRAKTLMVEKYYWSGNNPSGSNTFTVCLHVLPFGGAWQVRHVTGGNAFGTGVYQHVFPVPELVLEKSLIKVRCDSKVNNLDASGGFEGYLRDNDI